MHADFTTLRRVVIESPCAGDMQRNADYLRRALRDSICRGEAPLASHGLFAFSAVLDDTDSTERFQGMHAGWAWLLLADAVVVYDDLGISPGMQRAVTLAENKGIVVEYRSLDNAQQPNIATGHVPEVDGRTHPAR